MVERGRREVPSSCMPHVSSLFKYLNCGCCQIGIFNCASQIVSFKKKSTQHCNIMGHNLYFKSIIIQNEHAVDFFIRLN